MSGAIDLLYRDEAGTWVVVDYKTDRVDDEEQLQRRASEYAAQGAFYTRAVREARGLTDDPRFELWFLRAGTIWSAPS